MKTSYTQTQCFASGLMGERVRYYSVRSCNIGCSLPGSVTQSIRVNHIANLGKLVKCQDSMFFQVLKERRKLCFLKFGIYVLKSSPSFSAPLYKEEKLAIFPAQRIALRGRFFFGHVRSDVIAASQRNGFKKRKEKNYG